MVWSDGLALPAPFKKRPNLGARSLIFAHMRKFIPSLGAELGDWISANKVPPLTFFSLFALN